MRRVVLDHGLAARAAIMLRDQGWDAIHVREMSMQEAADSDLRIRKARVPSGTHS